MIKNPNEMGLWDFIKTAAMSKYGILDAYNKQQGQEQVKGLLGQAPSQYQMSDMEMFPGEAPIEGLKNEGKGLLGGKITAPEFFANLIATPGYEAIGAQGFSGLLQAQMKADGSYNGFKDKKEFLAAQQGTRKEYNLAVAPHRESLRKFGQATNIINKRGGLDKMDGADDTILIKAFASMILPGEAVMEGDISAIANQSGIPGWIKSFISKLQGNGQLDPTERARIYRAMSNLAEQSYTEYNDIRSMFQQDIDRGQFDPNAVFRAPMQYNPYQIPQNLLVRKPTAQVNTNVPPGTEPYPGRVK